MTAALFLPEFAAAIVTAGLVGLGVGSSVSPALFIVGFALKSDQIQRVFALVELLRGVAAFLIAPVLLFIAARAGGIDLAIWICLGIAGAGALGGSAVFLLGQWRLQVPDLDQWQDGEPAWESRPLLARVRG